MYSIRQFSTFYTNFQAISGEMTSLLGHFWPPESSDVISCHVTASSWSYSLVGSEVYSIRRFSAFSHFQVTSGQMTSLRGHLRPPQVT